MKANEAAKLYANTHTEWFDSEGNPNVAPAFEAGAEWADNYWQERFSSINKCFIAGANWQKEQMLKDTIDAEAVYMIGEGTLFNPEVLPDNIKPGDKVKLIIVKEEEK